MALARMGAFFAVAVLFLGPLWATGELGAYAWVDPPSYLDWDEGQTLPGHTDAPTEPGEAVATPIAAAVSLLLVPAVLVAGLAALRRGQQVRSAGASV